MIGTPEWISIFAPFASGAFGVGVAWGIIRQRVNDIERRVIKNETKLDKQVGEDRCNRMRDDCKDDLKESMEDLRDEVKQNRAMVAEKFDQVTRFMGRLNGKVD